MNNTLKNLLSDFFKNFSASDSISLKDKNAFEKATILFNLPVFYNLLFLKLHFYLS